MCHSVEFFMDCCCFYFLGMNFRCVNLYFRHSSSPWINSGSTVLTLRSSVRENVLCILMVILMPIFQNLQNLTGLFIKDRLKRLVSTFDVGWKKKTITGVFCFLWIRNSAGRNWFVSLPVGPAMTVMTTWWDQWARY